MSDELAAEPLEKSGPILLLENRRRQLMKWLSDGDTTIADCEHKIKQTKTEAVEMMTEIEQIERALNTLNAAQKAKEQVNGG